MLTNVIGYCLYIKTNYETLHTFCRHYERSIELLSSLREYLYQCYIGFDTTILFHTNLRFSPIYGLVILCALIHPLFQ